MKIKSQQVIKLLLLFGVTAAIFWYLFRDIPWSDFVLILSEFNYWWVALSMGLGFLSHFLRAYRWKILLEADHQKVWIWNSFFAVMIGYLSNSVIPRLGEITRCGVVNRKEGISVPYAFGTVFTERLVDLVMLLIITAITFLLQFSLLKDFFEAFVIEKLDASKNYWWMILVLLFIGALSIWAWRSKRLEQNSAFRKIKGFVNQGIQGIRSVKDTSNPRGFWLSTIGIWILYFLMLYVITLGSDETRFLGPLAGLSILVLGSFGMASPTPNGLGTFHAFVAGVLVLYGIAYDKGIIIATILHTSQFITILVLGSISLLLVNTLKRPESDADRNKNQG